MSGVDIRAPLSFLHAGYEADDWVAVFLKSYDTGETAQRVRPVADVASERFQRWLRFRNRAGWNIYVSANALEPGSHSRARHAVRSVRHVFLEADHDGARVLASIAQRSDLPPPSYLLHSSKNRVHIFWRVHGFDRDSVEALQKHLARRLGTDTAATSCSQTTRLPGFLNQKYRPAPVVTMVYGRVDRVYMPADFPQVRSPHQAVTRPVAPLPDTQSRVERARRYLAVLPPAIAGRHGDLQTFCVCCRLVRGFALDDGEALQVLSEWNARCEPPWTERELMDKLRRARQYGREPIGGLLAVR